MRILPLTLSCAVAVILAPTTSLAKGSIPPSSIAQEPQSVQEDPISPQQSHNLIVRQNSVQCPAGYNNLCSSSELCCGETCCNTNEICGYYSCIPAYGDVTTEPTSTATYAEPTETTDYPIGETVELSSSTITETLTSSRPAATTSEAPAASSPQPSETGTASRNDAENSKEGLSQSDKIALGVGIGTGVPSLMVAIYACYQTSKNRKKKKSPHGSRSTF